MLGSRTTPHTILTLLLTAPLSCTPEEDGDDAISDAQGCRSAVYPEPRPEDSGCGDGIVDGDEGEECDEGTKNDNTVGSCTEECTLPVCGDGFVHPKTEDCDDGNTLDGDACPGSCLFPRCGDGAVDPGEECDDGNDFNTDACTNTCETATCGDGFLHAGAEECDDGNAEDHDGCTSKCKLPGVCGDGVIDDAEECDDGNESMTCDTDCTVTECGDGVMNNAAGEECDDGGESMTCDADCTFAMCGDGTTNASSGEECDDAEESMNCDFDCTLPVCGDGVLNTAAGEECDHNNADDGDGCDEACMDEWLIFITSNSYTGALGGLAGADAICQTLAATAGVPGDFMAWLSDSSESPSTRFATDAYEDRTYTLGDGTLVTKGWTGLTGGLLHNAIRLDEAHNVQDNWNVWTNTTSSGISKGSYHCNSWSSASNSYKGHYGTSSYVSSFWSDRSTTYCSTSLKLYCVQTPSP